MFSTVGPVGFALTDPAGTLQKPPLFPTFVEGLHYDPEPFCSEMPRRQSMCEHGNCVRFHTMGGGGKHAVRSTGTLKGLEASATSLHSSGQDSGIVARTSCHCSHSSSPSSGESSNGYEDSLKSLQRRERCNDVSRGSHDTSSVVGRRAAAKRRQRFHSFSNAESVYTHEMSLQREQQPQQHCCIGTEKRRKAEHRRAHSEAENNITETVIHEHPGTEISLASSLPNTIHGIPRTSHMLY